jgi:hypothetical protein
MVHEDVQRYHDKQPVYRIAPDGKQMSLMVDDIVYPNGLCFSPDEKLLYVNCSRERLIRVYDVKPGASSHLGKGRLFYQYGGPERGVPDGMKCDHRGATSGAPVPVASSCTTRRARCSRASGPPVITRRISPGATTTGSRCTSPISAPWYARGSTLQAYRRDKRAAETGPFRQNIGAFPFSPAPPGRISTSLRGEMT